MTDVAQLTFSEQVGPLPFLRILVTGATGFVGRHLLPRLRTVVAPGAIIMCAVRPQEYLQDHESVVLDLDDSNSIDRAIAAFRPDCVIHLAAQASVGRSRNEAAQTWSANLCGGLALARALGQHVPDSMLFFVSSAEVYGSTFNAGAAREDMPLQPQSAYARSKAAAEAMLADVLPSDAGLIVVRPANHIGPGQDERFVLPSFAAQIARAEAGLCPPLVRVGNLDAERDFTDVRDVIEAYLLLLAHGPVLNRRLTVNIASGRCLPIRMLLDTMLDEARIPIEIEVDPERMRRAEIPRAEVVADALVALVNWHPRYSIAETVRAVLEDQRARI